MDIVETWDAEKVGKDNEVSIEYGCKGIYKGAHEDMKCVMRAEMETTELSLVCDYYK